MQICILKFKEKLRERKIKNCHLSRDPNILNESFWRKTEDVIRNVFQKTKIIITVCENILPIPSAEKRTDIIAEYHISTVAGHKGSEKTYRNISKQYY